jgi:hypothetical protein
MNKKIQNQFTTKDSELASLLIATRQILSSSYWEENVCYFLFEKEIECQKIIADYRNDKIIISAKTLIEAQRMVRGIIRYK